MRLLPSTPPGWFFVAVVAMPLLHVAAPGPGWLAAPWTLLGLAPLALGAALHARALAEFTRAGTTPLPDGRPSVLVRTGPYASSRNPMYLAGIPILVGIAALLGTATPALIVPLYAVAASRWVAAEEPRLRERFGPEWTAYSGAVRRWL